MSATNVSVLHRQGQCQSEQTRLQTWCRYSGITSLDQCHLPTPAVAMPVQTQWAHLDIAGPCWSDKEGGATGFGAATLAEWVLSQQPKA